MARETAHARRLDADADVRADGVATIAHRGFAGVHPENTLAAMRRATTPGPSGGPAAADVVEVDVMPCASGEVVVIHDSELARLAEAPAELGGRKIWEIPYDDLRRLDVLGSGERVPLLSDVFESIPSDVGVNVEFKNPGTLDIESGRKLDDAELARRTESWLGFAERALAVAADYDNEILVSSFCEAALAAVREVDESVPIAAVFWNSIEEGLAIARRHDCEAVHPAWNMINRTPLFNADYTTPTPFEDIDLVEIAHAEGRTVNVWTIENWYQATQIGRAGVDGLITDYPDLL